MNSACRKLRLSDGVACSCRPQGKRDRCFAEHWGSPALAALAWDKSAPICRAERHIPQERTGACLIPCGLMPTLQFRSRFHERRLRRPPRNKSRWSPVSSRETALARRRQAMRRFDSRRSRRKTMIVVAASLALGTATMATAAIAFARGGGGAHFAARHFGRGFGGVFGRPHGFGGDGLDYDDGSGYGDGYSGCYVPTPDGYAWACYRNVAGKDNLLVPLRRKRGLRVHGRSQRQHPPVANLSSETLAV